MAKSTLILRTSRVLWTLAFFVFALVSGVSAETDADFLYSTSVSIANASGSDLSGKHIPITMQSQRLIDGGYMESTADDVFPTDSSNNSIDATLQDPSINTAHWWARMTSLPNNTTRGMIYHTGNATYDPDQGFGFDGTDQITTADHADLDAAASDIVLEVKAKVYEIPSSLTYLAQKGTAYYIGLRDSNTVEAAVLYADATCVAPVVLTYSPIAANTTYTFRLDVDEDTDGVELYVDDVLRDSGNAGGALQHCSNATVFTAGYGIEGYLYRVRVGTTDTTNPTWVLDWTFIPEEIAETQEGDAGNGWVWQGTVEDSSVGGVDHDGAYELNRNMANVTVTVSPLIIKDLPAFVSATPVYNWRGGDVALPNASMATPVGTPSFPFYEALKDVPDTVGSTSHGFWFLLLGFLAAFGGIVTFRFTGNEMIAFIVLGAGLMVSVSLGVLDFWVPFVWSIGVAGIMGAERLLGRRG